ncbi:MAG TPA: hypothetical protein VFI33_09355, partial [Puia sp.]|nr:hypothetical protein [Puia sp.]
SVARIKQIVVNKSVHVLLRTTMNTEMNEIPEYVWEETGDNQKDEQALLYKKLISHLKELSPVHRIVFNMFVIDGFTHFYIANTLGISEADSRSNLSCARDILKMAIGKEEDVKLEGIK